MSKIRQLEVPDFREAVYSTYSGVEYFGMYSDMLKKYSSLNAKLLHNKINTDYIRYIANDEMKKQTKDQVSGIYQHVVNNFAENSICAIVRIKSIISSHHKYLITLSEHRPLDKIMDTRGCRIIIDNIHMSKEALCKTLDELVNCTIEYLLDNGFLLVEAEPTKDTKGFNKKKNPSIFVPKMSYIKEEFKIYLKNYVISPKVKNGYQSIHLIAIDSTGTPIEIQFRTLDMDCHSKHFIANHDLYKAELIEKYNLPVIDRSKVHWSNYRYVNYFDSIQNKQITFLEDNSGLEKATVICNLCYNP